MSDTGTIYPKIETGYAYTVDMNDELGKNLNEGNFTKGSAILKIKFFNPKNLIVQHLPLKEQVEKN